MTRVFVSDMIQGTRLAELRMGGHVRLCKISKAQDFTLIYGKQCIFVTVSSYILPLPGRIHDPSTYVGQQDVVSVANLGTKDGHFVLEKQDKLSLPAIIAVILLGNMRGTRFAC